MKAKIKETNEIVEVIACGMGVSTIKHDNGKVEPIKNTEIDLVW